VQPYKNSLTSKQVNKSDKHRRDTVNSLFTNGLFLFPKTVLILSMGYQREYVYSKTYSMKSKNGTSCKFRVGSNIRKWRNLKEIKQKDLATELNLSEAAVSNIENDITNLTLGQLEDISIALDVSIEQLLSDPQEKYNSYAGYHQVLARQEEQKAVEKELLTAVIASLEKKDEQLQTIMQHFIHTMRECMLSDKTFNSSKQVVSRV
jgi:transcriptional regulator with XRE-family HTH domain